MLAIALVLGDYRVMLPLAVVGDGHAPGGTSRWGLPGVAVLAHLLFAQLLILVVGRADLGSALDLLSAFARVGALAAIALAHATSFVLVTSLAKQVYRVAAHVAFMAWLATQLAPMEKLDRS